MSKRRSAGGAAATGGIDFQGRVAAHIAVQILAEQSASPSWALPSRTTLEWLRCETEEPVDDLLIGTSPDEGFVFGQVKHSLSLSTGSSSDLASVFDQFVRQFLAHRTAKPGERKWQRPLEALRDRLVLILGSAAPKTIYHDLQAVTRRAAALIPGRSLDSAAVNVSERHALEVAIEHIRASWLSTMGADAGDEDIRQLLSLSHVQVLDVDAGGDSEREAKTLLRGSVLRDPGQADAAWTVLVSFCMGLASARSGADRPGFQRALLDAGIGLQAPPSYRQDIQRLRDYSLRTASLLRDLSLIRVGDEEVKIDRRSDHQLRRAAEKGVLLVVGEPGAGKSGALHDLAASLERSRDVLFLAVDRLAASSLGALRGELNLNHDLTDVIANWPGSEPAFLVIDALDAARAEPAARALRDLIKIVIQDNKRWRVVASIRKFDLRYSTDLRSLFSGTTDSDFVEPEFAGIRHLSVPKLSQQEFDQIKAQSPRLDALVKSASPELIGLLSVPFNLRLIADLVGDGVDLTSLTPLRTQLELLSRYWQHRVIRSDDQGDAREGVLRRACDSMVQQRQLRVARTEVADAAPGPWLHDLLREHVLAEWQPSPEAAPDRYVLTFSHHVLFDYAVERLLLRIGPPALVSRLSADRDLVLVVRPSLELHFEHLWNQPSPAHDQFWNTVFWFAQATEVPGIGKVIGPAVAARRATTLSDLELLCSLLESPRESEQSTAKAVLPHLIGAILTQADEGQAIAGPSAGPWCEFLERASRDLRGQRPYTLRPLLFRICQAPDTLTYDQMLNAGIAARRVLEYAWQLFPRDSRLVIHGLDCVCQTFESAPAESAALIRHALEVENVKKFGFEELPWLGRHVRRLIPLDPELVQEIYEVTLSYREGSMEATAMVPSRIMGLQSHKSQDFAMAPYKLSSTFPIFLQLEPLHATRALISAMESYVAQEHTQGRVIVEAFDFSGKEARIRSDLSSIWDAREGGSHQHAILLLDAFEKHLETLGRRHSDSERVRAIIAVIVENSRLACIWRRLLRVASKLPATIGRELLPLATAMPILTFLDTRYLAGEYLKAIFQGLGPSDRERIEQVLVAIPTSVEDEERGRRDQERLLGCLPTSALVTQEARDLVEGFQQSGGGRPNVPDFEFGPVTSRPFLEEDYLREAGVPLQAEANRNLLALTEPVRSFAALYLNQSPPPGEVSTILPGVRLLAHALAQAEAAGVHPNVRVSAWDAIADACTRIVSSQGFYCGDEAGALVASTLLSSSRQPEPIHRPELDAQFDSNPSWGTPAPRLQGAEGLMSLARISGCATAEVLEQIELLSRDPVSSVRFQIAIRLTYLYDTAPHLMWRILERFCKDDPSQAVLAWLIDNPLLRLGGRHTDRVTALATEIFERAQAGPAGEAVRRHSVNLLAQLYIWFNQQTSKSFVMDIAMEPGRHPNEADELVRVVRTPLRQGLAEGVDGDDTAIRDRAWTLVSQLVRSTTEALTDLQNAHLGVTFDRWSEEDQEVLRSLMRLIDHVGMELYFASGAYQLSTSADQAEILSDAQRLRFYHEVGSILDALAEVGLASLVHHLLQTLESFIPFDPEGVFLRVARVVRAGQLGLYQFESLAADLLVNLVERYLAEYRPIFRDNEDCRAALLQVLDIFVQAGWPSARRLTYHLEEIFR